ncbi:MAG: LysR family transcriptional regulator [Litoreibacter sp.]|uniref:LysR family transcriptional regulator n=1 Tax=Litoreibacter sp. TaxID=1969459 RepID=UPI003297B9C9
MLPSYLSKADLHLLYVFIVVADARGFSAAQVDLNVSTSTISRQISDIETRLGMRLCSRGRGGFQMTAQGDLVYHAAKKLFQSLEEFGNEVTGARDNIAGHLSVGVVDNWISNGTSAMVRALSKFARMAPDVSLEIHTLAPDDLELGVLDRRISFGIGVFHSHKPGVEYEKISEEHVDLYCSTEHPLYNCRNPARLSEGIANAALAKRSYLNESHVAPVTRGMKSNAEAHQIEGIATLILTGHYIGYLPQPFAADMVKDGRIQAISNGDFALPVSIELINKRGHARSLVERTFVECLTYQST